MKKKIWNWVRRSWLYRSTIQPLAVLAYVLLVYWIDGGVHRRR